MPWASRLVAMRQGRVVFDGPPASYSPTSGLFAERAGATATAHSGCGGERVLSLERVSFGYNGCRAALDNISLSVAAGEIVAVVGPNGSGKTTLLNLVKGLLEPDDGRIICASTAPRMDAVGLVFQNPDSQLFAHSVYEECSFLPRNQNLPAPEISSRTRRALAQVGLESQADRVPFSLSYGEKRRLTLASTLSGRSTVLCLDEPTVGLDRDCLRQMAVVLKQISAVATRVVTLRAGHIVNDTAQQDGAA